MEIKHLNYIIIKYMGVHLSLLYLESKEEIESNFNPSV